MGEGLLVESLLQWQGRIAGCRKFGEVVENSIVSARIPVIGRKPIRYCQAVQAGNIFGNEVVDHGPENY